MSDQGATVDEKPDAGNPPADPKPVDPPALSGQGDPPADPPAPKPDWPEDWRDKFVAKAKAEEREALGKRLARFASPDNVLSSYLELDRKLRAGSLKPTLADGASEDEIANYRKAWGVPETAEGYGISYPEGLAVTDADKADLTEFQAAAHKMHIPAAHAKGIAEWFFASRAKAEQAEYDAAHERTINQKAEIKAEFGKDYDRNVRLAKADLTTVLGGPERAEALVSLTLADGTKLGDHPEFIRYAVAQALKGADESSLITSDLDAAGKSVEDAYQEAINLRFTDPTKYHSDEHQKKLLRLSEARLKRKAA